MESFLAILCALLVPILFQKEPPMIMEIGIVAGEIWHFLDEKKSATADELTKGLKRPRELVMMSLGWLAREGHVTLGTPESGYSATLNRK
jgi:hypothetical protein